MTHTPGPWVVSGECNARYLNGIGEVTLIRRAGDRDDRYVAMASLDAMGANHVRTTTAERQANACLIAAAPDLLEALKSVLRVADRKTDEFDAARAAIAKAEGRTPTLTQPMRPPET